MKRNKIFAIIVYFLVTFVFGIMIALFLPFIYMYDGEVVGTMASSLEDGRYQDAMSLVGGYYQKDHSFQQTFSDGSGMVLFPSIVSHEEVVEIAEGDAEPEKRIFYKYHNSYAGFLYGIGEGYPTYSTSDNQTKVVVYSTNGASCQVNLLDYSVDENDTKDAILTVQQKGLVYLDFNLDTLQQAGLVDIDKIIFVDKDGKNFPSADGVDVGTLAFDAKFFVDVADFLQKYNQYVDFTKTMTDSEADKTAESNYRTEIAEKDKQFLSNSNYAKSSAQLAQDKADSRATVVVIVYFVAVYVLADFLFGTLYVVKSVKWVLAKVFKVQFKTKQKAIAPKETSFGNDYYCKVTLVFNVDAANGFDKPIVVQYADQNGEVVQFNLSTSNKYQQEQRVKAGTYTLSSIDLGKGYKTENLPDKLIVEGFYKSYLVKIFEQEE